MTYTTKATWLGTEYGCRVFYNGKLVVEGRCQTKDLIGPTFRDLLRTMDKCGGDAFTSAARYRKNREGNKVTSVKHWWGGKKKPNVEFSGAARGVSTTSEGGCSASAATEG